MMTTFKDKIVTFAEWVAQHDTLTQAEKSVLFTRIQELVESHYKEVQDTVTITLDAVGHTIETATTGKTHKTSETPKTL